MDNDLTKTPSRRQVYAVVVLLSERTIAAAASVAGVSERMVYRWLRQGHSQA